ncbi:MAG: N-acetylgalactosamine 6-sulfate sulfatase [Verrucomicrobia bacterium]|nr:MAG: N-acetylgalactosamine 6-sulfate sulfatase [Verrucomicrobiota bacterium]
MRHFRIIAAGLLALALPVAGLPAGAGSRPNVVVFLADDQGWGDLSIHGNRNLATPNIDSLARDGALFEHFYVCAVCSPTRAEFLTGRYHPRGGVYSTGEGGERLDLDERTIAESFRAAGYATGAFGKWHNGTQGPYHPNARGFQDFYGFTSGHWGHYFSPLLDHNGRLVQGRGYLPDDCTEHAMAFIEQHRHEPFFVYLPFNVPHAPMQVPERFYRKFAHAELTMRNRDPEKEDPAFTRAALAMVENIDWNVGRVLRQLDRLGLAENTIVLYFSDNGPNSWRWNGGMKGRKGWVDEGGVRSPLLIRWPGRIPAGRRIPQIAAAIDLLPTLLDLAGIPRVGDKPLDGRSLRPLLLGDGSGWPEDRLLFSHWRGRVSVRSQRFRLDHQGALFDMEADPGQRHDVAAQHPQVAARLRRAVERWKAGVLAELGPDDRPFPVGYAGEPGTQLPARDARPSGHVHFSGRWPNCAYLIDWKSPEDRIVYDVEVLRPGRYEATVYYDCPPADVGALIQLRFGDRTLTARLTEPHDPPLVGMVQDRVPRQESYVKDWRPWRMGTIDLPAGRGRLELSAPEIPGRQAMEFRLLLLRRLSD